MLTISKTKQLLDFIKNAQIKLDRYSLNDVFPTLEARYTLFQLSRVIETRDESKLEQLLAKRWPRIIKLNHQYLHDFTNPANEACIEIAKLLEPMINKPYLTILMPTLAEISPDLYITSAYNEELNLREVVLSDSNDRLIHVLDALDNAKEDGLLKHNSLFPTKTSQLTVKELSPSEKNRVFARHPSVTIAHEALQARIAFKYFGDTAGGALNALIKGLRKGGFGQQGTEFEAGEAANIAIGEFNEYLSMVSTINPKLTQQLMAARKKDRYLSYDPETKSVKKCWSLLSARDPKIPPKDRMGVMPVDYCVRSIANDLEEILDANPHLYELLTYGEEAVATFHEFNEKLAQTRAEAETSLQTLTTHPCYNQQCDYKQRVALLKDLDQDQHFILTHREISFVMECYSSATIPNNIEMIECCKNILLRVSREYPPFKIMSALALTKVEIGEEFIQLTQFQKPTNTRPSRFYFHSEDNRKRKAENRPDSGLESANEAGQTAKRIPILS